MAKSSIPPAARDEILDRLLADSRISSREIAGILKRHQVSGDVEALQDHYRKRLGQQLLAGIRDEDGRREILAVSDGRGGTEYIIVDFCNDPDTLRSLLGRLSGRTTGLDASLRKVERRIQALDQLSQRLRKVG